MTVQGGRGQLSLLLVSRGGYEEPIDLGMQVPWLGGFDSLPVPKELDLDVKSDEGARGERDQLLLEEIRV